MIVGVSMFKDEEDIAASTVGHLLAEGVDHLIIADNLSTDGTRDILESFEHVTVVEDFVEGYYQAAKMTALAHRAGALGAEWIIPFDADELWSATRGTIAESLRYAEHDVQWVEGYYHIPHADDPAETDPVRRMVHRRAGRDCPQSKVAFRYHPSIAIHPGNHNVDHPSSPTSHEDPNRGRGLLAFREFQYRSYEHYVRKVRNGKAVYDATDQHELLGIHWRRLGAMTDAELEAEWARYLQTPTEYDPAPYRVHV